MSYLHQFGATPQILKRIVGQIKPERFDERTSPDRFTLREAVAHLADFEETLLDRFTCAHEYPGGSVPNYDEDARAIEKKFAERDVHHELEVFQNRRRDTLSFLQTLSPEDLEKTFVHPKVGEQSIKDYWGLIVGHDLYHLDHATSLMN